MTRIKIKTIKNQFTGPKTIVARKMHKQAHLRVKGRFECKPKESETG